MKTSKTYEELIEEFIPIAKKEKFGVRVLPHNERIVICDREKVTAKKFYEIVKKHGLNLRDYQNEALCILESDRFISSLPVLEKKLETRTLRDLEKDGHIVKNVCCGRNRTYVIAEPLDYYLYFNKSTRTWCIISQSYDLAVTAHHKNKRDCINDFLNNRGRNRAGA